VATFKDDSEWVNQLLFNEERVEGMLLHLAKAHPETYVKVGTRRKLSMKIVSLDTAQTMALARIGRLNDIARTRVWSFLRCVGHIDLKLSLAERQRIDVDVGLYRTKEAIFGSYLHEWSLTKGRETKPPEMVHFWNSKLSNEIEAEVDLYISHLFFEQEKSGDKSVDIPSLDYLGGGGVPTGRSNYYLRRGSWRQELPHQL
jgi:hypothetical protein